MISKEEMKEIKNVLKDFGIYLTPSQIEEFEQLTPVQAHNRKLDMIRKKLG